MVDASLALAQLLNTLCDECENALKHPGYHLCEECYRKRYESSEDEGYLSENATYEEILRWEQQRNEKDPVKLDISSIQMKQQTVATQEKEDCAICIEPLKDRCKMTILTNCNHKFHTACIDVWIEQHKVTCPLCMQDARKAEK